MGEQELSCKRRLRKKCGTNFKAHGTMFNKGGTMVAVQWYERVPGGIERRGFAVDVFNSRLAQATRLRHVEARLLL